MTQNEIATQISKSIYAKYGPGNYHVAELAGFLKNRPETYIQYLPVRNKFPNKSAFVTNLLLLYSIFNPHEYNPDNIVVWIYVEENTPGRLYVGYSRELTNPEIAQICTLLKAVSIDKQAGQSFGILVF